MPSPAPPEKGCGDDDRARLRIRLLRRPPTPLPLARVKKRRFVEPDKYSSVHIEDVSFYCFMFKQVHLTDRAGVQVRLEYTVVKLLTVFWQAQHF